jgi:hypothetical protein
MAHARMIGAGSSCRLMPVRQELMPADSLGLPGRSQFSFETQRAKINCDYGKDQLTKTNDGVFLLAWFSRRTSGVTGPMKAGTLDVGEIRKQKNQYPG